MSLAINVAKGQSNKKNINIPWEKVQDNNYPQDLYGKWHVLAILSYSCIAMNFDNKRKGKQNKETLKYFQPLHTAWKITQKASWFPKSNKIESFFLIARGLSTELSNVKHGQLLHKVGQYGQK